MPTPNGGVEEDGGRAQRQLGPMTAAPSPFQQAGSRCWIALATAERVEGSR
jgi:hypothetical protein